MDQATKELLKTYLSKLLAAVESGANFAAEQVPLIIQEKLLFDFWQAVVWAAFNVLILITIWVGWYAINRVIFKWEEVEAAVGSAAAALIASLFPALCLFWYIGEAMKITLAPRLYIIEWLRTML